MLWVLFAIEFALWLTGLIQHHVLGGFIHGFLALALLALGTELGLRFRRRQALIPQSAADKPEDWPRAA